MFFDSHAHLTSDAFLADMDEVIQRAMQAQVHCIVNICTDRFSLEKALQIRERYPNIFHAAATPPHDVDTEGEKNFPMMEEAIRSGKLVAVGETGLDYHYKHSSVENQKKYFIRYLKLALDCELPCIVHCREAFEDFFQIIDSHFTQNHELQKGVLHCFTGTLKEAKQLVERGWYLSLSAITTFKKSHELREVAKYAPIDQLLIETDAPYLAPQSKRGKRNEPSFLSELARLIADLKSMDLEDFADKTSENARRLFSINT